MSGRKKAAPGAPPAETPPAWLLPTQIPSDWFLSAETVLDWIDTALGSRKRPPRPSLSTCSQIAAWIISAGLAGGEYGQERRQADQDADDERLQWLKAGRAFARGLSRRRDDLARKQEEAPWEFSPQAGNFLAMLGSAEATVSALLALYDVPILPPADAWQERARRIAIQTRHMWPECPKAENENDPFCLFVTDAIRWIAERRGERCMSASAVSDALRGRRGKSRRTGKGKNRTGKRP